MADTKIYNLYWICLIPHITYRFLFVMWNVGGRVSLRLRRCCVHEHHRMALFCYFLYEWTQAKINCTFLALVLYLVCSKHFDKLLAWIRLFRMSWWLADPTKKKKKPKHHSDVLHCSYDMGRLWFLTRTGCVSSPTKKPNLTCSEAIKFMFTSNFRKSKIKHEIKSINAIHSPTIGVKITFVKCLL